MKPYLLFYKKLPLRWVGLSFLIPLLSVSLAWGQEMEGMHGDHTESSPPEASKNPSKMETRGLQLSDPMPNFGLKFDFGSFLSDPKTVGGGLGAMGFLGAKSQLVVEGLARIHYVFNDAPINTMFETDVKFGYLFPLSKRVGLIFKIGFGYMGFYSPSASHATPQNTPTPDMPATTASPDHHYLTIPLEGAFLYDLSRHVDLELSSFAMPMFELNGKVTLNAGLFVGLIFHPRKLMKAEDSSGSAHQHH